jgi:formylglycine-generating enzyme required for sulfatase activity
MGSPEDEEGRWQFEGPRREVSPLSGFWIFDTLCTQALWQAVMGENPSDFQGPDRPVENITWDECQAFLDRLNRRVGGLNLDLPSEAQWEYACRAGTKTPRYLEDLDAIAWFGDNSGGETHQVGQKAPNTWGLYDMLGNVWEWSSDAWREDHAQPPAPVAREASARRVIRGGSWNGNARSVRAAYRGGNHPLYRSVDLGFRCAEFREGVVSSSKKSGAW